jgi:hypothetical protein
VSVPSDVVPSKNCTCVTPWSSLAVACTGTFAPDTVAPSAGLVTDTDGGASTEPAGAETSMIWPSFSFEFAPLSTPRDTIQ